MKHFYSISLIALGLVILYLSLKKNPQDWFNTLLIVFVSVALVFFFFYYKKKKERNRKMTMQQKTKTWIILSILLLLSCLNLLSIPKYMTKI